MFYWTTSIPTWSKTWNLRTINILAIFLYLQFSHTLIFFSILPNLFQCSVHCCSYIYVGEVYSTSLTLHFTSVGKPRQGQGDHTVAWQEAGALGRCARPCWPETQRKVSWNLHGRFVRDNELIFVELFQ